MLISITSVSFILSIDVEQSGGKACAFAELPGLGACTSKSAKYSIPFLGAVFKYLGYLSKRRT